MTLYRPHSDVPMVLGELEILSTLQKRSVVFGSTCNSDCEFVVSLSDWLWLVLLSPMLQFSS